MSSSGSGAALPSYSMPPVSAPTSGQPRIYQSTGAWPTVAAGPEATQVVPTSGVPHQRGTVYGGADAGGVVGDMTIAVPTHAYQDAVENTGSLTGHILSQGWSDINQQASRNNRKVVLIMAAVLVALVGVSLLVIITANDFITGFFGGIGKGLG